MITGRLYSEVRHFDLVNLIVINGSYSNANIATCVSIEVFRMVCAVLSRRLAQFKAAVEQMPKFQN